MKIRLLIVEDHTLLRQGLRVLLDAQADFEIAGEASDGSSGVTEARRLQPDVVLMDLSLPGLHGAEATRRIKNELAGVRVLVLSMHTSPEMVARACEAGCDGYVVKSADLDELGRAIRAVHAGQPFFSADVRGPLGDPTHAPSDPLTRLSGREREVLQLIAEGNTNKSIAQRLGISVHTVNAHRVNLMSKLDLHDAQGITRFALRHGLVDAERLT
jgi:DNA-binding NarL/FixJ family response regulator